MQVWKLSALSVVLILLSAANCPAHLPQVSAHATGKTYQGWAQTAPNINGEIVASEWERARSESFSMDITGNPYSGTFYVMNDASNLYIGIKIADDDFNTGGTTDVAVIYFDSDNDGTFEPGEDSIAQFAGATGFVDRFLELYPTMKLDFDAGGTNDGSGACAAHGGYNHFEFSHPLNSADDAHDFSLQPLNTVGFTIGYRDGGLGVAVGYWPALTTESTTAWGDIVIASAPPSLSAWCSAAPTIDGNVGTTEWSSASHVPIAIGWTFIGDLWVMNDAQNLYLAVKIADSSLTAMDRLYVAFDNNNDGTHSAGDDTIGLMGDSTFMDFYWAPITKFDTDDGGTSDGDGKCSGSGGFNYFEFKHPLNSADNAHDFSLSAGDTVGFLMEYWEDASGYWGDWPSLNMKNEAHITVASGPEPDFSLSSDPVSISLSQGSSASSTIRIQSTNGFSSAVSLSPSWLGVAPSGVTVDLPGSVTPPADGVGTATLTLHASATAETGSFTLQVTGTGSHTHTVDVPVSISTAATTTPTTTTTTPTTTTTTPTTTTTTPTTTTTTTTTTGPRRCIIATAAYGSEVSPEVQFLRSFRDTRVLETFAGSSFMTAFNALYYSFSPAIAQSISESEWMRFVVRMVLYPLIAILHVSTVVFDALSSAPEVAIITAGLVASGLIGACYLAPVVTGIRMALWRRRRIHVPSGVLLGVWSSTIVLMVFAEALAEPTLMMCATAGFVLATLAASTLCVSGRIVQRIAR